MTTGIQCEKCKGTGLEPRDGGEADKDIHPILSREPGLCTACGGSGQQPVTPRRTGWRLSADQILPLLYAARAFLRWRASHESEYRFPFRASHSVSDLGTRAIKSAVNKPV